MPVAAISRMTGHHRQSEHDEREHDGRQRVPGMAMCRKPRGELVKVKFTAVLGGQIHAATANPHRTMSTATRRSQTARLPEFVHIVWCQVQ